MTMNATLPRRKTLAIADTARSLSSRFIETFREWQRRVRSRRDLRALDDRELWDIRVTRVDCEREARKPFWRA
jgi:uncharacterized protein YjiS (DUF1127 family)